MVDKYFSHNKKGTIETIAVAAVIIFVLLIFIYFGKNLVINKNIANVNQPINNKSSNGSIVVVLNPIPNESPFRPRYRVGNLTGSIVVKNVSVASYCGDGICTSEEMGICSADCIWCGDGFCDLNENCQTCSKDCGNCSSGSYCGDSFCTPEKCKAGCTQDCRVSNCIDGICEPKIGENCLNSVDCACNPGEMCDVNGQCQSDYCGNGVCNENKTCENCVGDCVCDSLSKCLNGACKTYCGNGVCESNENSNTCPQDCGSQNYTLVNDPNSNYPIIFIHGHSLSSDPVSTYSVNGFTEFQNKLESDGLYKSMGVILPNSNINDYLPGEWARFGNISVRTTYYIGILSESGSTINNDDAERSIDEYGQRLSRVVDIVLHHTGKNKVILIAHSMGGLVARSFIENYNGANKVDKLIMIGTPNHGYYVEDIYQYVVTYFYNCAQMHPGQECSDMAPGSNFLNKLNNVTEIPGNISSLTIAGSCCSAYNGEPYDEVIRASSVKLNGSINLLVKGNASSSTDDYTFHGMLIMPSRQPLVYNYTRDFLFGKLNLTNVTLNI